MSHPYADPKCYYCGGRGTHAIDVDNIADCACVVQEKLRRVDEKRREGESWKDARIAQLERALAGQAEIIRSFQDGYHTIAAAFGIGVGDTNDEDLAHRVKTLKERCDYLESANRREEKP